MTPFHSLPRLVPGLLVFLSALLYAAAGLAYDERDVVPKMTTKSGAKPKSGQKIKKKALRKDLEDKDDDDIDNDHNSDDDRRIFGIGVNAGSGATYGNGVTLNLDPWPFLRTQAGLGYNSTGFKSGLGVAGVLPLGESFALDAGAGLVHSFGAKDEVSMPAKFTAENSSTKEDIKAVRKFRMSPGNYYSVFAGSSYAILPQLIAEAHVNYNKVINGHVIEFYDGVSYDRPIEASNEESVQNEFEQKARQKLNVTGVGFSVGAQFRF